MPGNLGYAPQVIGEIVQVTPAAPAAGANYSYVFPAGYVYRVQTFYCQIVTGAAVANRQLFLTLTETGANRVFRYGDLVNQAASLTCYYNHAQNMWFITTTAANRMTAFPDIIIPGGWTLATDVANIQAADQISNICITLMRWQTT